MVLSVLVLLLISLLLLTGGGHGKEDNGPIIFSLATVSLLDQTGRQPNYYLAQLVDHLADSNDDDRRRSRKYAGRTWSQRFYSMGTYFGGPGSPLFVFLGGEGAIEPGSSLHYPFVTKRLAPLFQAFVLHPEHRFYGESQPIPRKEIDDETDRGMDDPRLELLTSEQALHDYVRLIREVRDHLGCSRDKFSRLYCPVVAVGGSYPGWLSAMARHLFPFVVDVAYAASAPVKFYAQQVPQDAYYDRVTEATDQAFPGCAGAVRTSLDDVSTFYMSHSIEFATTNAEKIGICNGTLPDYCASGTVQNFVNEVVMMAGYTFANMNMGFYPPSAATSLGNACEIFLSKNLTSLEKVAKFFVRELRSSGGGGSGSNDPARSNGQCFNMSAQLPTGRRATITAGDWSGVGTGASGDSWDFQTCTLLVEAIGFGNSSMFPPRSWSVEWLERHCQERFHGAAPDPLQLVRRWGFDDLAAAGASHILFTNGLVDGWSVSGVANNLSDTLISINFPRGAHHSDLSYYHGLDDDATDDIRQGRDQIQTILADWLASLPNAPR
jgi:hypothetical protein